MVLSSSNYQVECFYQRTLANNANYANNDHGGIHLVFLICNRNAINTNLTSVPVLNSKNGKKMDLIKTVGRDFAFVSLQQPSLMTSEATKSEQLGLLSEYNVSC